MRTTDVATPASPTARAHRQVRRARRFVLDKLPDDQRFYGQADPRYWWTLEQHRRAAGASWEDVRWARRIGRAAQTEGRFLATLPRSGTHWLVLMLNLSADLSRGGDGEISYRPDPDEPDHGVWQTGTRIGWDGSPRALLQLIQDERPGVVEPGVFVHSHCPPQATIVDPRRMPATFLLRDPITALDSRFRFEGDLPASDPKWLRHMVRRVAMYFNYWGERVARQPLTTHALRYEDLMAQPESVLRTLSDRWRLALDPHAIEEAVLRTSRDRLRALQPPTSVRVSDASARSKVPDEVWERVHEHLAAFVHHDFGYDLTGGP